MFLNIDQINTNTLQSVVHFFYSWLLQQTNNEGLSQLLSTTMVGAFIVLIALLLLFVFRKIFVRIAHQFALNTKTEWDDILLKNKFFIGLAHLAPASFIYYAANFSDAFYPGFEIYILKFGKLYFLFAAIFIINALLSSINEIYNKSFSLSKERPLSGFIQLIKIFSYFIALLILISIVSNLDLSNLFKGLGAVAAILLLIFKDTILGFVASIQISMNDMVKVGDWIAMPSRGADGDVIEIKLHTVKVQNWDKTISMIPTYSMITETFVNWKGMEQSGGRRIKRSINIDMNSVKFCSQEMLHKFEKFVLIKDYVQNKQKEIEEFNSTLKVAPEDHYNGRRQTNLGIFRKYLEAYLNANPNINTEMTFLVRHLQPTETGIPVEIYVFSKDQAWAKYEAIQADIFDHVLAVIPEFDLKVFQSPSGRDFQSLAKLNGN
ncbi:MAG: mechanosensitive ion channel family protein [Prolixibacteraceae bacterium]